MRNRTARAGSPYLDRASLRSGEDIVAQMADDMRVRAASAGCVTEDDLAQIGWSPAQITTHGRAATRQAHQLASR